MNVRTRLGTFVVLMVAGLLASCRGGGSGGSLPPATPPPLKAMDVTAAPSAVQWANGAVFQPASITVKFKSAPATGDLLIVAFDNNAQTNGSANTYTPPDATWTQVDLNSSHTYHTYQAFSHVVASGETNSYVFTPASAVREHVWIAVETTGGSVDVAGNAFVANSATYTTPSLTPSQSSDLALAFNLPVITTSYTWTNPPAPWTLGSGPTSTWHAEALYDALSSNAPISESATASVSSTGFAALILLAPGGAQGTPTPVASVTPTPTAPPSATPTPVSSATPTPTPTPMAGAAPSISQWTKGALFAPASITVSFARAPAAGDLLVVAFWNNGQSSGASNTYTPPAGWSAADQNTAAAYATYQVFTHTVSAGEANSYAFIPFSAQREHAWIGADVTNAMGVDRAGNTFINNGTSFTTPALTPYGPSELAIAFNLPLKPNSGSVTWTNPSPPWAPGASMTSPWAGEALYQSLSSTSAVTQSATSSTSVAGFSGIVLLSNSPTPIPTATPYIKSWHSGVHGSTDTSPFHVHVSADFSVPPAPGDFIVVAIWNNGQNNGASNPYTPPDSSWTLADSDTSHAWVTYQLWTHVAVAGESYPYIFTPVSLVRQHCYMVADIINASPVVDGAAHARINPASTTYASPTLTPTKPNDMAIIFNMPYATSTLGWTNDPAWTAGIPLSLAWNAEALMQQFPAISGVKETSILQSAVNGWSGVVLVSPSGS